MKDPVSEIGFSGVLGILFLGLPWVFLYFGIRH